MSRRAGWTWGPSERPVCPEQGLPVAFAGACGLRAHRSPAWGPKAAWARLRDEHGAAPRRLATTGPPA